MNFATRLTSSTRVQAGAPTWVAVKPYEYDSEAKRMVILMNPEDPYASSQSNLVFATFTGTTLDFGVKWFIGGQDDTLSIKFADGLDLAQVNHFYNKHGVPVEISVEEVCYLLTGIEGGIQEGPGGVPPEKPEAPREHVEPATTPAHGQEPAAAEAAPAQAPGGMIKPPQPVQAPVPPPMPKPAMDIPVGHSGAV